MGGSQTVSVVIPTFFHNDALRTAIRSARTQDYENTEVVVIDDSGEQHAAPAIDEFDVVYIPKEENEGPAKARLTGLQEAEGDYIHFLDDDDRLSDHAISKKLDVIRESEETGVVYSGYRLEGKQRTILPDEDVRGDVLRYALQFRVLPCIPSTMLIDRDELESLNWDRIILTGVSNEHGMLIQLADSTEFDFVSQPLLYRSEFADSFGRSSTAYEGRYMTLKEFEDLYQQFPDEVYRTALSYTNLMEGQVRINNQMWSTKAILAFAKAVYHSPGLRPLYIASLFASVFGQPSYTIGRYIYQILSNRDDQRGKRL